MAALTIDDFLRAEYPGGYRRLANQDSFRTYALKVQAQAFPSWRTDFEVVLLSSRRRECRQGPSREGTIIAMDQGLSTLLALQDQILRTREPSPEEAEVLASLVFAEALYHHGLFERAYLCGSECLQGREALERLCTRTFRQRGHSGLGSASV